MSGREAGRGQGQGHSVSHHLQPQCYGRLGDAVTFALEPHPQALGLGKLEEMCQELGELVAQMCRQPQGELGDQ